MGYPNSHKFLALALLLLLFLFWPGQTVADGVLKVNTSIKPPFSTRDENGFFDIIVQELSRRTGIRTELVRLPPERALRQANEGLSDIEIPRIAGMEKMYPHLIMVPEKVVEYRFVAFSRTPTHLNGWADLEGRRVGFLIGWKIFEEHVPPNAQITRLKTPPQLLSMLSRNRIDIALYEAYAGNEIIRKQGFTSIREISPPLAVRPMYIYVHDSNAYLVPLLDHSLKAMKKDGTYQKILRATLGND